MLKLKERKTEKKISKMVLKGAQTENKFNRVASGVHHLE